jgi:RNase adapter protein RapZ
MQVEIFSYSIKYRKPLPVSSPNFIFDCRGVKNPGRIVSLRKLTGLDPDVIEFLKSNQSAQDFMKNAKGLVLNTLDVFIQRQYTDVFVVAFCCTGGRHRSVYFSEQLAKEIENSRRIDVTVSHLDIGSNYI